MNNLLVGTCLNAEDLVGKLLCPRNHTEVRATRRSVASIGDPGSRSIRRSTIRELTRPVIAEAERLWRPGGRTRRGLTRGSTDPAETRACDKKSLCLSASCRETTHRSTWHDGQPWFACRRVSPSMTYQTSCSWFAEETYRTSVDPFVMGAWSVPVLRPYSTTQHAGGYRWCGSDRLHATHPRRSKAA
jgi:hypothetical protein